MKIHKQLINQYEQLYNGLLFVSEVIEGGINEQHLISSTTVTTGYLLFYVRKGQGTIYANQEMIGLKQNDCLIIDLSSDFYITSHDWSFIYVHINGDTLSELIQHQKLRYSIKNSTTFEQDLYMLFKEDIVSNQFKSTSILLHILDELFHNPANIYNETSHQSPIKKALEYIDYNFMKNITVLDIAEEINFSKFYFIRMFKNEIGKTPYQYILETRLNHAKHLLTKTDAQIKQVAKEAGFRSEENFHYTFKKENGITPLQYRKKEEKDE